LTDFKKIRRICRVEYPAARRLCFISSILVFLLFFPQKGSAYILSTEQILDLTAKNFAQFKTVAVTRTLYIAEGEGRDASLEEVLYLKTPGFYARQPETGAPPADIPFLALLMPLSVSSIAGHLTRMGINTNERALVLHDRIICYRIGGRTDDDPVLLVEKQRRVPILVRAGSSSSGTGLRIASFKDYRKIDEDWYPFETIVSDEGKPVVRSVIKEIKVNPAIPPGVSFAPIDAGEKSESSPFQETIKVLREKYR
jgi:hypothetical protein